MNSPILSWALPIGARSASPDAIASRERSSVRGSAAPVAMPPGHGMPLPAWKHAGCANASAQAWKSFMFTPSDESSAHRLLDLRAHAHERVAHRIASRREAGGWARVLS